MRSYVKWLTTASIAVSAVSFSSLISTSYAQEKEETLRQVSPQIRQIDPKKLQQIQIDPKKVERPVLQIDPSKVEDVKLGEEQVDERRIKIAEDRFRTNVNYALKWIEEHPEQAEGLFMRSELADIRKAMQAETLETYMAEEERKYAELSRKGIVLQPTIYLVADFGSTMRASANVEAEKQRLANFTAQVYGDKAAAEFKKKFGSVKAFKPEVYKVIQGFWLEWDPIVVIPGPVKDTSRMDCTLELGYHSTNSDSATACLPPGVTVANGSSRNFSSTGLMATREIPLEPYLTCTKSQGRRGSCVGFAVTANLETRASVLRNKKYNFSEQYNYFKSEIYTGNNRYSYGLSTHDTVEDWADGNWETGRETTWRYNPSPSIKDIDTGSIWTYHDNVYPDSCVGYTPHCTDYAFQGTPNSNHTVFTRPSPQTGTDNLGAIQNYRYTWGWLYRSREDALMDSVVPLLNAKIPVIVSYTVTDNYMNLGTSDYLVWSSSDGQRSGGHATLIVGYVSKDNLPSGAPTPVGNGYFIIKNSWGANRADCGYEYIDEKWLREQMKGLSSLTVG